MEAEAKAFENEKKNNPEEDDHDTRKLPKPERMRLVVKNKDVRLTALVLETVASFQCYIFFSIFGALCSIAEFVRLFSIRPSAFSNELRSCLFTQLPTSYMV